MARNRKADATKYGELCQAAADYANSRKRANKCAFCDDDVPTRTIVGHKTGELGIPTTIFVCDGCYKAQLLNDEQHRPYYLTQAVADRLLEAVKSDGGTLAAQQAAARRAASHEAGERAALQWISTWEDRPDDMPEEDAISKIQQKYHSTTQRAKELLETWAEENTPEEYPPESLLALREEGIS